MLGSCIRAARPVWLCNYLDISSYIWVKIFASREEMLFFGWSFEGHIWAWSRQGRGGDGALTAPAQATLGYWHSLYSTTSHSAFPKNIFLYIQCGCHVSCQQSCQYETNPPALSGAVPPRPRLLPAAAVFSWKITLFLLYIIINIFQWPPNHLKLSEIDLD